MRDYTQKHTQYTICVDLKTQKIAYIYNVCAWISIYTHFCENIYVVKA